MFKYQFRRIVVGLGLLVTILASGCSKKKQDDLPPLNPRPGSLEFCIVANDDDDDKAISAAQRYFDQAAKDPVKLKELKDLAEAGDPPGPPKVKPDEQFKLKNRPTTYRWVEVDPRLVRQNKFDELQRLKPGDDVITLFSVDSGLRCALWSRPCTSTKLSHQERLNKGRDFFILVRNAEPGNELTEAHLEGVRSGINGKTNQPAIDAKFNKEGTKRMRELTEANQPLEGDLKFRQLATMIERKMISLSSIRSVISDQAQITVDFSTDEVEEVLGRIRPPTQE